ncbi:General secretion pathway, M protein [Shimia sp. SK013]|uniref:type II secretion system protein GspM n=1 Tax=Shimia sp. SK013 TaxID=1389006 RepID=UPI0006B48C4A|nr:type II secretion system protein GspM [Shimia sp. SK013]KPA19801.1 General secretion pathway, M protein [Shimia sp. SK013]
MTDRLIDMLGRLSGRERALLGLLLGLVLPLALRLAWLAPLLDARADALRTLHEARALEVWVTDRAAEHALLSAETPDNAPPPIGASGVEQRLIDANLRTALSALSDPGDGTLVLRFDTVGFTPLILWLSASEPVWGYEIPSFRFERTDTPGIIAADLTLSPRQ